MLDNPALEDFLAKKFDTGLGRTPACRCTGLEISPLKGRRE